MGSITPHILELAQGRAGLYRLLGQLLLSEPTGDTLAFLKDQAALESGILPAVEQLQAEWLQAVRVEYSHLFLLNVYPYASIYLDREAMLNTGSTEEVRSLYELYNFQPPPGLFADHLGLELLFLAHLAQLEVAALTAGQMARAVRFRAGAGQFLKMHLLEWLPVFQAALARAAR